MKLLLFVVPIGLGAVAYAHESFPLLMASVFSLLVAAAANLRYFRTTVLVVASVAFSWTLVEAALSAMEGAKGGHISFYEPRGGDPVQIWRVDDAYGALPRPGQYRAIKQTERGEVVYDVLYTIGEDGFRSTPQSRKTSDDKAFFLGDSATFGEGLQDDQTLPFHWMMQNPGFTVKNMGMSAWGLHQAYLVWEDLVREEYALVIVQTAPWHADRSACIPEFSAFSPRFELVDGALVRTGKCRVLVGVNLLDRILNKSRLVSRAYLVPQLADQDRKFEIYIAIIKKMQSLARARRQCLVIAFNKAVESYFGGSSYSNDRIVRLLREADIEVVDVTLAARKEDLEPKYYIANDGHPTDLANRAKARQRTVEPRRGRRGQGAGPGDPPDLGTARDRRAGAERHVLADALARRLEALRSDQ
jgi:hypothetical protein